MSKKLVRLLGLVIILSLASDPAQASHEIGSGECPRIQSADPPEDAIHMVRRGETLFSIAKRYGSSVDALAHANGLADPTRIYVGQQLTVPGG
ncbi:MAG: LysM domain-containing protein, partial [Anaerolineae bacterium]